MNAIRTERMDICEYHGEGYCKVVENAVWTAAMINYASRFDEANFMRVERHLNTDEAFVLLAGKATLIVGDRCQRVEMEALKVYNVKAGEWHHILVSRDARVLVMENSDTGPANTEYRGV